jgi:hypothetical protein
VAGHRDRDREQRLGEGVEGAWSKSVALGCVAGEEDEVRNMQGVVENQGQREQKAGVDHSKVVWVVDRVIIMGDNRQAPKNH